MQASAANTTHMTLYNNTLEINLSSALTGQYYILIEQGL